VELRPIIKDKLISVQKLPAVTVCYENYLHDTLDRDKQFFDLIISKSKQNISENQKFLWTEDLEPMLNITKGDPFTLSKYILLELMDTFPNKYKQMFEFIINYMIFNEKDKSLEKYSHTSDEMNFFQIISTVLLKLIKLLIVAKLVKEFQVFHFLANAILFYSI
jgi:hypothetical protein